MKKLKLVVMLFCVIGLSGCDNWKGSAPATKQEAAAVKQDASPATPPDMKVGKLFVEEVVAKKATTDLSEVKKSTTELAEIDKMKVKKLRVQKAKVKEMKVEKAEVDKMQIKEAEFEKAKFKDAEFDKAKFTNSEFDKTRSAKVGAEARAEARASRPIDYLSVPCVRSHLVPDLKRGPGYFIWVAGP